MRLSYPMVAVIAAFEVDNKARCMFPTALRKQTWDVKGEKIKRGYTSDTGVFIFAHGLTGYTGVCSPAVSHTNKTRGGKCENNFEGGRLYFLRKKGGGHKVSLQITLYYCMSPMKIGSRLGE